MRGNGEDLWDVSGFWKEIFVMFFSLFSSANGYYPRSYTEIY